MLDSNNLVELIKKAANEANEASEPSDFCYGKVTSTSPLKILVEQRMELGKAQLVLTRNVTDFKTSISTGNTRNYYFTGNEYDGGTAPVEPTPHVHAIGTIQVTVHNALKKGDEVILIKKKGGQKYLVLDRVVTA